MSPSGSLSCTNSSSQCSVTMGGQARARCRKDEGVRGPDKMVKAHIQHRLRCQVVTELQERKTLRMTLMSSEVWKDVAVWTPGAPFILEIICWLQCASSLDGRK